eukprot:m.222706 g.222706  ORF g.222706 m.222706 type:complete len:245 (+) comp16084_c0_seq1:135-869(+)
MAVLALFLGLLALTSSTAFAAPNPNPSNGITCEFCEFAISELAKILVSNSTETDFEKGLDYLCRLLPASDVQECTNLVASYGPEFMQFIVNELNPQAICTFLDLCSAPKVASLVAKAPKPNDITCDVCTELFNAFDTILTNPTTVSDMEGLLTPLCNDLGPLASTCVDFVDQFTPEVLAYLAKEVNATSICDFIGVCPLTVRPTVLGGAKCTMGPAYWCSSVEKAQSCNAQQYCTLKGWNNKRK